MTKQHFPEKARFFISIDIALLSSIQERRHEKAINYKNQLLFQLNQITDCKNIASKNYDTEPKSMMLDINIQEEIGVFMYCMIATDSTKIESEI